MQLPSPASPLSRRSALAGLAAVTAAVTAGCTARGAEPRSSGPRPSPSGAPTGLQPDVALASTVLGHQQEMLDRLRSASRRRPALRRRLAGARAVHRAHVVLLTRAVPASAPASSPPVAATRRSAGRGADRALAALADAESALAGVCAEASLAARSGAFARVLASMAAAATQQSAVLGATPAER